MSTKILCDESELPLREVSLPLGLTLGDTGGLVDGQLPPEGTGLLVTKVQRLILGTGIVLTESIFPVLVENSKDTGNRLTHDRDLAELGCGSAGHLGDAELGELGL